MLKMGTSTIEQCVIKKKKKTTGPKQISLG